MGKHVLGNDYSQNNTWELIIPLPLSTLSETADTAPVTRQYESSITKPLINYLC